MENIIESQIKPIPEIQKDIYNDDLHLDIKEYKKGINNKYNNIINEFNKIYDNKMNNILIEKHKLLKEELNSKFTKFSNVNVNTIFEIKKDSEGLKEEFSERVSDINGMDDAILKMSKIFPGGEIKLPKKKKKIPKNEINDDEENDGEEKISVIFKDIEIKEEINLDQTKYIDIPIKIENVGDKMPEKLFYVKDEEESSKDIIFVSNRENIHQLSMTGNFNKNVQEVHSIYVRIKEPKPNQEYNLYLYVKNKMEGKNVSNKLKIVLKVKGEEKIEVEDPKKKLEEEAIKLYSELSEKYDLKIITTKEEAIKKFIEFENDNDKINKWINDEFNKKCDDIYEKLNISNIVEKDEAKNDFSRLKYDEAKIKEWAQSKIEQNNNNKAENLYKKLEAKFKNLNEIEKNEVIEKIKEENFNEENIIKWIEPQIKIESDPEPEPEPIPNPIPGPEDAKLDETVKKYDVAYGILSIVEEDDFKAKIKELNFDDEKITEWIEKTLSEEI